MNTADFFALVLPDTGHRCVVTKREFGYAHHTFGTNNSAAHRANFLDGQGETVFFACATLKEKFVLSEDARGNEKRMYRKRDNLLAVKSFWLDLDVGEGDNKYPTQQDAITALFDFLGKTALPAPLIVNSGYGAHIYFPLTESISPEMWRKVANLLHSLIVGLGLKADPSRTRDVSSILRPVGTMNRKNSEHPIQVTQMYTEHKITTPTDFTKILVTALKNLNIPLIAEKVKKQPVDTSNSDLSSGIYKETKNTAHLIAEKCSAMRSMRDTQGDIPEPLWYGLIGVLNHTLEGSELIHQWSCGYDGYSEYETDAKIAQSLENSGPTTCIHIQTHHSDCAICPHNGLITSPIQLGKIVEQPEQIQTTLVLEDNEVIQKPVDTGLDIADNFEPKDVGLFEVTQEGVIFKDSFEPGHKVEPETKVRILEYPMIIKSSAQDERKGGVIEIEYLHPTRGRTSFYIEKSMLAEKTVFYKELLRNHVTISAGKIDLMKDYMLSYLQDLDRTTELQMLYNTMGWKDSGNFVLGANLLAVGKPITNAGLGMHLEGNYCSSIKEVGDYQQWAEMTKILGAPGLERHALSLLWGFGAPLMRMTGFDGTIVNLMGETNAGKSTMGEWTTSIYGDYRELKAQKSDTYNSLMGRLGTLNNLPMVIDEITNIEVKDVSDLVYSISQGREKTRMTSKITDVKPRTWNTIVISTSNASLTDKLMSAKSDPEAERMRLIEYRVSEEANFKSQVANIHSCIKSNYGGVGIKYMQYVLNHYDEVFKLRIKIQKILEDKSHAEGKERFWIAAFSAAMTGGLIAQKIGLVKFNVNSIFDEVITMLKSMRGDVIEDKIDYTSILGRYLNTHASNVIFVRYTQQRSSKVVEAVFEPQREMYIRVEHDHIGKRMFIDKRHMMMWLNKAGVSTSEFVQITRKTGLMISLSSQKVLGQDWANNPSNAAIPALEFYIKDDDELAGLADHPVLSLAK